jgi:hypothetical protein
MNRYRPNRSASVIAQISSMPRSALEPGQELVTYQSNGLRVSIRPSITVGVLIQNELATL